MHRKIKTFTLQFSSQRLAAEQSYFSKALRSSYSACSSVNSIGSSQLLRHLETPIDYTMFLKDSL